MRSKRRGRTPEHTIGWFVRLLVVDKAKANGYRDNSNGLTFYGVFKSRKKEMGENTFHTRLDEKLINIRDPCRRLRVLLCSHTLVGRSQ